MISEINAAIKRDDFQQVKILVEAFIEKVSNTYGGFSTPMSCK